MIIILIMMVMIIIVTIMMMMMMMIIIIIIIMQRCNAIINLKLKTKYSKHILYHHKDGSLRNLTGFVFTL